MSRGLGYSVVGLEHSRSVASEVGASCCDMVPRNIAEQLDSEDFVAFASLGESSWMMTGAS